MILNFIVEHCFFPQCRVPHKKSMLRLARTVTRSLSSRAFLRCSWVLYKSAKSFSKIQM